MLAPAMLEYAEANHTYLHGFENKEMGRGHWNQAGHRLAAELIAQTIETMLTASTQAGTSESVPGAARP